MIPANRAGDTEGFDGQQAWVDSSPPTKPEDSSPVKQEKMDRTPMAGMDSTTDPDDEFHANLKKGGAKMSAPDELGHSIRNSSSNLNCNTPSLVAMHPATLRTRRRCRESVRRYNNLQTPRNNLALETAAAGVDDDAATEGCTPDPAGKKYASLVTTLCYRGMEVVFATTGTATGSDNNNDNNNNIDSKKPKCYGICSRTRLVFQTLDLPSDSHVLSIISCAITGQIVIAQADGTIQTYLPEATDPAESCYGKYRWIDGPRTTVKDIFYQPGESAAFHGCEQAKKAGERLDISLSYNYHLLVSHRDQLAVFNTSPTTITTESSLPSTQTAATATNTSDLLWATQLPRKVSTAKISGDGMSIALVLEGKNSDSDGAGSSTVADGVHTFERDVDDGSLVSKDPTTIAARTIKLPKSEPFSAPRTSSVGILYKPGPFLVHSKPVTRLSFRGLGHVTSNVHADEDQGNDLLLTYCSSDSSCRIFGQNCWRLLTEWTTPNSTRVDWVAGIAAFSLGDLESQKRLGKKSPGQASSVNAGVAAINNKNGSKADPFVVNGDVTDTMGTHNHFQSIPNHTTPSSNAGAWVSEITFQGPYPALRLSRLTYLKRGVDDLNPTLFESVAGFLPIDSVHQERILGTDESGLSVEGIWPAWNPWLSESSGNDSKETPDGSAMAFLGLSHGPSTTGGGFFGDSLLGGTQSPPGELRLTSAHSIIGEVSVIELKLFGDVSLATLEFGSPLQSVMSLSDIKLPAPLPMQPNDDDTPSLSVSIDYESSRLVARTCREDSNSLSITWRKQGGFSLLPSNWLPEDVERPNAASLLADLSRLRDDSLIPVPLALPRVRVPPKFTKGGESIEALLWWPDDHFGGPPLLLAVMNTGTIICFELPPPWSALEPILPNKDEPFPMVLMDAMSAMTGERSVDTEISNQVRRAEYNVNIFPDPDHGLGLRLESQMDGLPAVAGSFKKNPLNKESLPAEKTGMISLGDELVAANGVNLEDKSFDVIISTVRDVGSACTPGNPVRLTFRKVKKKNNRRRTSSNNSRRSMEQIFGVSSSEDGDILPVDAGAYSLDENAQVTGNDVKKTVISFSSSSGPRQQYGRVVGVFDHAVKDFSNQMELKKRQSSPSFLIAPFSFQDAGDSMRSAMLFLACDSSIRVYLLTMAGDYNEDRAHATDLGSWKCDSSVKNAVAVRTMHVIQSDGMNYCLAVGDSKGVVHLLFVDIITREHSPTEAPTQSAAFRQYDIFRLDSPCPPGLKLRACSTQLLATMQPEEDAGTITIWSAKPQPGCIQSTNTSGSIPSENSSFDYYSSEVAIESSSANASETDKFIEFSFVHSGCLDVSPALVTFSMKRVALYRKQGGSCEWLPLIQIAYCSLSGSRPINQRSLPDHLDGTAFEQISSPRDIFPHLIPALFSVDTSCDEANYLRTDWHPESLLAHICTDKNGVSNSLRNRIRRLFLWLCSEGKTITEDHLEGPLLVSPLTTLVDDDSINGQEDKNPADSTNRMMHLLSMNERTGLADLSNTEATSLRDLKCVLQRLLSGTAKNGLNCSKSLGRERIDISASAEPREQMELPLCLMRMAREDLHIVWALCELLLDLPNFQSLDSPGQLFVFSTALFRKINDHTRHKVSTAEEANKKAEKNSHFSFGNARLPAHKTESSGDRSQLSIASAGCLSALISNSQAKLVEKCRRSDQKVYWSFLKELRLPFWMRSDVSLARLAEEVGQNLFREKRDVMECALFFIIARKMNKLRNLAATDSTHSGRTFYKFLNDHDFSSERGRRAAEKNAFSLLRKCRYSVAAAFFLLAEPPSLKLAIDIIATKMKDLDLAFMVARLMESSQLSAGALGLSGSTVLGFGAVMGGGGGYGSSAPAPKSSQVDEGKFTEWKPCLGKLTRQLLVKQLLPASADDKVLTAVQLLWLKKEEQAWWMLSGSLKALYGDKTSYNVIEDPAANLFGPSSVFSNSKGIKQTQRALEKANQIIDFVSGPLILKSMSASARARFASSVIVSRVLMGRGIEIPSMWSILCFSDTCESEENNSSPNAIQDSGAMQSSIFDSFDVPVVAQKTKPQVLPPESNTQSSIFDSFDVPNTTKQAKAKSQAPPPESNMQSSIFDSFDVPSAEQKNVQAESSGTMRSSIFGSFFAPAVTQKTNPPPESYAQSSIFDSFDVPNSTKQAIGVNLSGPTGSNEPDPLARSGNSAQTGPAPDNDVFEVDQRIVPNIESCPTPRLWVEWRQEVLMMSAARRFLREVASVLASFHGDPSVPTIEAFYGHDAPLLPSLASEVLQVPCDAERILNQVQLSLVELCSIGGLQQQSVLRHASHLLTGTSYQHRRTLFLVVIHAASGRCDLAEDAVREASSFLIQLCHGLSFSHDDVVYQRKTRSYVSTQFLRRLASRISWQLESCLWLHRGGGLPLSGLALKEAVIAVRIGLLTASWNRNYECLEAMIRSEPDCLVDEEAGRCLWTSLKVLPCTEENTDKAKQTSSGGWEFLVDCRRSEATSILRNRPTGCFIIRPHAQNHGVFTLSFKTNLIPTDSSGRDSEARTPDTSGDESSDGDDVKGRPPKPRKKSIKKDDVVQHAIIRLSDSGFRCGSFGPFASLINLLEAVSSSLPFKLRFDKPPTNRVIREEGSQPSPNAVFLRKLCLSYADNMISNPPQIGSDSSPAHGGGHVDVEVLKLSSENTKLWGQQMGFGLFFELLVLSMVRKQLSSVAAVEYDEANLSDNESLDLNLDENNQTQTVDEEDLSLSALEDQFAVSSRILCPLLVWCRAKEVAAVMELSPGLSRLAETVETTPVDVAKSSDAIEVAPHAGVNNICGGDAVLRRMIQQDSGVEFSTLRLVNGSECTMVVLFSKNEAVQWLVSSGSEQSKEDAIARLGRMEKKRVIEQVNLSSLPLKQKVSGSAEEGVRYRLVDPWEVEAVVKREGETRSASLGREQYFGFSLGKVAMSSEVVFRQLGGLPLLELWTSCKGGIVLTKALASVHPPWEKAISGDLQVTDGTVTDPPPFFNSIRQHLYRNALFRRLGLPQRFMALIQVELLDLKNLTSPGGSMSMTVYSLLRLKRSGSGAALTNKARTLDSAATQPVKLGNSTGPNAPASWGTVVRFRFPLPEDVSVDGVSFNSDQEILFKGPPCVLQVSVYEKRLLMDQALGMADINTDGLWAGGQIEEWVPLRCEKNGINWFARIRLTLRFELMCVATGSENEDVASSAPSVGLQRLGELSQAGGAAHEDFDKRSMSSPDLMAYFENMVY